ncbi:ribosomal protein S5 domain 2-like protein [Diplogelasinospora grovesii]|uniref:Ribosomal RNA-processing protein 43 n=1 Tax=Diplogelasinospora grovesii TaxID=303347 RepID=A0AAN6MYU7_9PEZI|nr:ribosomal protein S5 domain 2-like protein [Diplogelasinospora grovesii]
MDTPPTLSLSRSTFAKLSPHPYLVANLTGQGRSKSNSSPACCRTNGRTPQQARPLQVHPSSLTHAHGSALVRNGDTTVICGVRAEILPVSNIPQYRPRSHGEVDSDSSSSSRELRDYDLLVPNIELATGCATQFLPGVPPTTLAQTLSTRVYSLLHSCHLVDAADLRIWHNPKDSSSSEAANAQDKMDEDEDANSHKEEDAEPQLMAYWVLYIDLLFVSFDGNPFDAAWTAVLAALHDTKLPSARWDPDREMIVCSPPTRSLRLSGLPIACTAAIFVEKEHGDTGGRHWILLDPDRLEETLCREVVTMVVDCSDGETRVRAIEKHGGTVIGRELIRAFAGVAEKRWTEVQKSAFLTDK